MSAGSSEPVLAYTVMSLILSAFNAVWRTTIPALAGDQVGAVMNATGTHVAMQTYLLLSHLRDKPFARTGSKGLCVCV